VIASWLMPVQSACAIELRRKLVIFESAHERSLLTIKTSGERPRMYSVKVSGMTRLMSRQIFRVSNSFRFGSSRLSFVTFVKFRGARISYSRELFRVFPALMDDESQLFPRRVSRFERSSQAISSIDCTP